MHRVLAVSPQRPDGMADADHPVRGGGRDAGQQPRPPDRQHLAPRLPGNLAAEVRRPVGDPARITERLPPAGADRRGAAGKILEPAHVPVQPRVHHLGVPAAHHGLGRHRAMIGQPALKFRASGMQPLYASSSIPVRSAGIAARLRRLFGDAGAVYFDLVLVGVEAVVLGGGQSLGRGWGRLLAAKYGNCRRLAQRLGDEDVLTPGWTVESAADMLNALATTDLIEALVV